MRDAPDHRRRTRATALAGACVGVVLALAPSAYADKQIQAGPNTRYLTTSVTMDQGERLTFQNFDVAGHDVSARDEGPDGKPLFKTPIIGQGEEAFVEGSQYLTTGSYGFFCTVHPQMQGTLTVTSAGTPQPRPSPGDPPATDTTRPDVDLTVQSARIARVRRSRRLSVAVTVDEAAEVTLTAVARALGRRVTIAKGKVNLPARGTRRQALRLTPKGRELVAARRSLRVTVTARAVDRAGNASTATARRKLTG